MGTGAPGNDRHPGALRGRLYGVLVTYRRPAPLAETLRRIWAQRRPLDRLVVVDNHPDEEGRRIVSSALQDGRPIDYLPAPENLGPAGGIALGMRHVLRSAGDRDWVVTLDDDDPPKDEDVLEELETFAHRMLARDARTGAVGLVGARFDGRRGRLHRLDDGELAGPVGVDYVGGAHFPFLRVAALRDVGPFRSDLFFGLDDLEFGLRLRAAGYRLYVDGDQWRRSRQLGGRLGMEVEPSRTLGEPTWRRYYSLRNAVWILRKHGRGGAAFRVTLIHGLGKPLANLVRSPASSVGHLRLNWSACRDAWAGRMGRTLEPGEIPRPAAHRRAGAKRFP